MILPLEQGIFATSTPLRHASSIHKNSLQSLLSPVSAQSCTIRRKLQTLRRGCDSGYLGSSPESRDQGPLPFLRRATFHTMRKIFQQSLPGGELSTHVLNMLKRSFLTGFRTRLFSRPTPVGRVDVEDVHDILNTYGAQFEIQFTIPEAHLLHFAIKASQLASPVQRGGHRTDSLFTLPCSCLSEASGNEDSGMEVAFEASGNEDSGVEVAFDDDSLNFGLCADDGSHSYYGPLVPQQYDFLKELNKMKAYETTSLLLSYLSPKDLQAVSSVGKQYRSIVENDYQANRRRCRYLIEKRLNEENRHVVKSKEANEDRVLFQDLLNKLPTVPKQPLADQSKIKMFDSFVEVGKTIHRSEILLKCPKCCHPSRRINGGRYCCTRQFCSYEFCRDCNGPYLNNHKCQKLSKVEEVPKVLVGSCRSKRNLRRL